MSGEGSNGQLRLAELLAPLSLVIDLGMGHPSEEALRSCVLATRLAEELGLPEREACEVYYTTLLAHVGCFAVAHEMALVFGGDELAVRRNAEAYDFGSLRQSARFFFRELASGRPPVERLEILMRAVLNWRLAWDEFPRATCDVGATIARRLRLPDGVRRGLLHFFERWDGKGKPAGLRGEEIPASTRFAQAASQAVVLDRLLGPEGAAATVRVRAGGALDPTIARTIAARPSLLAASEDVYEAALACEPGEPRVADGRVDEVTRAFGDVVDLKSPHTVGHSAGTASLAAEAARLLGLDEERVVSIRRAGHLHDLGRASVASGIWDKEGPLTRREWELVRLHPYHTERILSASSALASIAPVAAAVHERLDGSGYHRGLGGSALPLEARLLAAADEFNGKTQPRAYRVAASAEQAAEELAREAKQGTLDADAVRAVLEAAGAPSGPVQREWPDGLTEREVEVLRLVARGRSTREVAQALEISPKTADHHLQHAYRKMRVSTRAAATLYAMEHELLLPA